MKTVADLTIRLNNSTAVYHLAGELFDLLPTGSEARYWRFFSRRKPAFVEGRILPFVGRIAHKLLSRDFDHLKAFPWPRRAGARMLFVDPIFCAVTPIEPDDIALIHDMGTLTHSDSYDAGAAQASDRAYRAIQAARPSLVFVSAFTRDRFLELYPAAYLRAEVIPLYVRSAFTAPGNDEEPVKRRTVLMVGGLEHRKNHARAIDAFRDSRLAEQGYTLKITGPSGNAAADIAARAAATPRVELLGFVSNDDLLALYKEAEILLFPSLLEGFGLPAIEAPKFGAVPIVSRASALEEIVGADGVLVDPMSVDEIAEALRTTAALSSNARHQRVAAIRRHQQRFTVDEFRAAWRRFLD